MAASCLMMANTGGGGMRQARISAAQNPYKMFVRNLFGVFKDLCR